MTRTNRDQRTIRSIAYFGGFLVVFDVERRPGRTTSRPRRLFASIEAFDMPDERIMLDERTILRYLNDGWLTPFGGRTETPDGVGVQTYRLTRAALDHA